MTNHIFTLLQNITKQLAKLPMYVHACCAVASYALTRVSNVVLDKSYAASQYPVPFYVGQTTFSADKLKSYYSFMLEQNTLTIYWKTQYIDFFFIASVFIAGIVVSLFLARLSRHHRLLRKFSLTAAVLIPLGALFDACENLVSFVMLRQPTQFPAWLALPYSSFAVLKFVAMGLGYAFWLLVLLGLASSAVARQFRRLRTA